MGVVGCIPNTMPIDAGKWSRVVTGIAESAIHIDARGEDEALFWCGCVRGRVSLGIAVAKSSSSDSDFYYWCGLRNYWFAPLATRRLIRDIVATIKVHLAGSPA